MDGEVGEDYQTYSYSTSFPCKNGKIRVRTTLKKLKLRLQFVQIQHEVGLQAVTGSNPNKLAKSCRDKI